MRDHLRYRMTAFHRSRKAITSRTRQGECHDHTCRSDDLRLHFRRDEIQSHPAFRDQTEGIGRPSEHPRLHDTRAYMKRCQR